MEANSEDFFKARMGTRKEEELYSLFLQFYKVPRNPLGWFTNIINWAMINVFISSIAIVISAFLPYVVQQLKPKTDEVIVAISVTAISVALTNSQFPDEIRDMRMGAQKWIYNSTLLITIFCLMTIIVFSLKEVLPGINTKVILNLSILYAVLGILVGLVSHILQLKANDEKLTLARSQISKGYAEDVQESVQETALEAKENSTVNGAKI